MIKRRFICTCAILVLIAAYATVGRSQSMVNYVYDETGRLVAVIDTSGNVAVYNYDAVGNILSISRTTAAQVSIIEFTPKSGPVGTAVTIWGTGFSSTASNDSVTFNGTAATVTSATTNSIVTSVPAGASTGPISVTTPAGSANSSVAFTVTPASGAPTVTGFTPSVGAAGAPVTISGSNFMIPAAGNRVGFNSLTLAPVSSSTSTQIVASVPADATTGHISVTTPFGSGASSQFFFVPPPSYTVSTLGFTGAATFGVATNVSIANAGVGLVAFDAIAGQRVSVEISNDNPANCWAMVGIAAANGASLASTCASNAFIDAVTIPITGTSTLQVYATPPATGNVTLTLFGFTDIKGTITAEGPPVGVNITTPGQNAYLSFQGTAGQRVSLLETNNTLTNSCDGSLSILKPDGTVLVSGGICGAFLDATSLPLTGTYNVFVNPGDTNTGGVIVQLYNVVDFSSSITAGGAPVPVNITTPGQNAELTFSGSAGQQVSVNLTNGTFSGSFCSSSLANISILNPDGSTLTSLRCVSASGFIDTQTLPANGTYTILVDPQGPATGNITVTLYNIVNPTGTIASNGTSTALNFTTPGQDAQLTFNGTAGQRVSIGVANSTLGCPWYNGNYVGLQVTILNPDGSTLFAPGGTCNANAAFGPQTLPTTGIYTLVVDPPGTATGSVNVTLYNVADFSSSITPGGSSAVVNIAAPGDNGYLTFSGTSGQRVSVLFTNATWSNSCYNCFAVAVLNPDGSTLASAGNLGEGSGFNGFIDAVTLPSNGTYTIAVWPYSENTGNVTVTLYNIVDVTGPIVPGGPSMNVTLTTPGQNAELTFSGTAGQSVGVNFLNATFSGCNWTASLLNTDGTTLSRLSSYGSNCGSGAINPVTLPNTGTYTIKVDPQYQYTGGITVTIPGPIVPTAPPSRPAGSVLDTNNPLATSLVGLFLMNEAIGSSDINLVDGQVAGFSGTSLPAWNTTDPSIIFNGGNSLNSYVDAGTDITFDQLTTSQITIVAKAYISALSTAGICEKNDNNSSGSGFVFGWDSTGAIWLTVEKSAADMRVSTGPGAIAAGEWLQVAFTWDGTSGTAATAHLYVNGVEQAKANSTDGSGQIGYSGATNQPFRIGNASFDIRGSLNGKIAYLAVYKGRILSPAQIAQLDQQLPIK